MIFNIYNFIKLLESETYEKMHFFLSKYKPSFCAFLEKKWVGGFIL